MRRSGARDELHFHGGFRGPRLLQLGDTDALDDSEGALPGPDHTAARQPRIEADHQSVRILRRVPEQVRERERLEVLLPSVRLADDCGGASRLHFRAS